MICKSSYLNWDSIDFIHSLEDKCFGIGQFVDVCDVRRPTLPDGCWRCRGDLIGTLGDWIGEDATDVSLEDSNAAVGMDSRR